MIKNTVKRISRFYKQDIRTECFLISKCLQDCYIICQSAVAKESNNTYYFTIYVYYQGRIEKAKIKLEENFSESMFEIFKIIEAPNAKRNRRGSCKFLIYSQKRILIFTFETKTKKISISKLIYQQVEVHMDLIYCEKQKHFLVPSEDSLDVWDRTFSYKVYSIELNNKIKGFVKVPDSDIILL